MALTLHINGSGFKVAEPVSDLAEASRIFQQMRDHANYGQSQMPDGFVRDDTGDVARISYNGRVWPLETWVPGMQPIMEAA